MWLLTIYVVLMIVGDVADYLIGLVVERIWPEASHRNRKYSPRKIARLAWVAAVKLTEPRKPLAEGGASH